MRLFKPIEHAQAALRAAAVSDYPLEQFTTIGRQLGYFGYLSLDMIVWVRFHPFSNTTVPHNILWFLNRPTPLNSSPLRPRRPRR